MKSNYDIETLESEIMEKQKLLAKLKRESPRESVSDYTLKGIKGPVKLSTLFDHKQDLIIIHNMGIGCKYCTLWADGFNGLLDHLKNRAAFAVVSPDGPLVQQNFARERGWKFDMYSGEDSTFIEDMGFKSEIGWMPGVSTFTMSADGKIFRVAHAVFGPYDPFNSIWHLFALLSEGINEWKPRFHY
ncbi:MAG: DUF899 family protein [Calditrichaceae bacterium]